VTWQENQPTASHDVREAINYLMDDLKAAIVLGSQPEYLDELYRSLGTLRPSDGVTIHTISEDFRKYDQRASNEATLVEIVLQLKPLTTAAGFKTHKSITRYLKALEECKKIPGLPSAFHYYQDQFRIFSGIIVGSQANKSDLWTAFSGHNTWQGVLTVDQAMDQCQWITSPTAWANFAWANFQGEPVGKATKKLMESSFYLHEFGHMVKKQGVQAAPKAQPDAAIVDLAPKRKFNLE
jgi:hypothetical protein